MVGRPYHAERDLAAVTRMWREVGWIDDTDGHAMALRNFLDSGFGLVADVGGQAECLVHRTPGSIRHEDTDLPLCAITAVTTSHVARRQGLASALMVEALQAGAAEGAAVAALGAFEQGFYDRVGFGTGAYEIRATFDPSTLAVDIPSQPPVRLTQDDAGEMHDLLVRRRRGHGSVVIDPPRLLRSELAWTESFFALGYRSDDGRLTSFLVGSMKDEHGPYEISWLGYERPQDLLDVLGLCRALGDQVAQMTITAEPAEIQLQDLIRTPMRQRRSAGLSGRAGGLQEAVAELQIRILDLRSCIEAVHLDTPPVAFGLRLRDPLADRAGGGWPGVGGDYTVRLGATSTLAAGLDETLPVLDASVNALSRLWFGVRPASSLALTDDLRAPDDLLSQLDRSLRFPVPQAGWIF